MMSRGSNLLQGFSCLVCTQIKSNSSLCACTSNILPPKTPPQTTLFPLYLSFYYFFKPFFTFIYIPMMFLLKLIYYYFWLIHGYSCIGLYGLCINQLTNNTCLDICTSLPSTTYFLSLFGRNLIEVIYYVQPGLHAWYKNELQMAEIIFHFSHENL